MDLTLMMMIMMMIMMMMMMMTMMVISTPCYIHTMLRPIQQSEQHQSHALLLFV